MDEATQDGGAAAEVRELAREFATAELRPHGEAWDAERSLGDAVLPQLAELGFFGMRAPESAGGLDFDLPTYVAALEELAWGEPAVALTVAIHSAVLAAVLEPAGSGGAGEWGERLASGEALACLAVAEEQGGEDLSGLETAARRDGDGWVLNGAKAWVTNGDRAAVALVVAKTDEAGLGAFLVPLDSEGITVGERAATLGLRPLGIVGLTFENVRLGGDALVGRSAADGHPLAAGTDARRLATAALAVGIARAALEHALGYAAEREQFGTRIREFEAMKFKLADMATRVHAARLAVTSAARSPQDHTTAMARVLASEAAVWVTNQAVQVFGGYGYMRDYPVEKLMRDAKATELLEETNERLRIRIAEALYRS
jgi:alkylation response protein AidB-like acyl-CoA dehydrogenase